MQYDVTLLLSNLYVDFYLKSKNKWKISNINLSLWDVSLCCLRV